MVKPKTPAAKTALYVLGYGKERRSDTEQYTTDKELAEKMLAYYQKVEDTLDITRTLLKALQTEYPEWRGYGMGVDPQMRMHMEMMGRKGGYYNDNSYYNHGMDYLKSLTSKKEFEEKFIALNISSETLKTLDTKNHKRDYYLYELEMVDYKEGKPLAVMHTNDKHMRTIAVTQDYDQTRKDAITHNESVESNTQQVDNLADMHKFIPNSLSRFLKSYDKPAIPKAELQKLADDFLRSIPAFAEIEQEIEAMRCKNVQYNLYSIQPLKQEAIDEYMQSPA